jgi:hypothetical protein
MQQNITSPQGVYFSKQYYHIPFPAPTLSGARVAISSQVCAADVLLLLVVKSKIL